MHNERQGKPALVILGLILLPFYAAIPLSFFAWTWWLRHRTGAPSKVSGVGYALSGLNAGMFAIAPFAGMAFVLSLIISMDSRPKDSLPKSTNYAEPLGSAMQVAGVLWAITFALTVLWLFYATWRYRWSVRAPVNPETPPYR